MEGGARMELRVGKRKTSGSAIEVEGETEQKRGKNLINAKGGLSSRSALTDKHKTKTQSASTKLDPATYSDSVTPPSAVVKSSHPTSTLSSRRRDSRPP